MRSKKVGLVLETEMGRESLLNGNGDELRGKWKNENGGESRLKGSREGKRDSDDEGRVLEVKTSQKVKNLSNERGIPRRDCEESKLNELAEKRTDCDLDRVLLLRL